MKKENKNVVVASYPSCEEQPLAPESFYPGVGLPIKRAVVGQAPGVRVDHVRATRLRTCNPLATARGRFAVVGQALPDNATHKGHLSSHVILNSFQDLHRLFSTRGFTLIELLVVVLIIGILAAVAVPQYKKAVEKTKILNVVNLMRSVAKAEEVYYTANGSFTTDASKLDIDVPFSGKDYSISLFLLSFANGRNNARFHASTPGSSWEIYYYIPGNKIYCRDIFKNYCEFFGKEKVSLPADPNVKVVLIK